MSRKLASTLIVLISLSAFSTLHYLFAMFLPQVRTHSEGVIRWGSDFRPRWEGTRAVLTESLDPYSQVVTTRTQTWFYGAPLPLGTHEDLQRFAYPGHTVLLLAPFGLMTFSQARILMTLVLLLCTTMSLVMWVRMAHLPVLTSILVCMFAASGWSFVEAVYLGQPTLLVLFFLTAAVYASWKSRFLTAGFFLALSTIKPQLALPCIAWLTLWGWFQKDGKRLALSLGFICGLMFVVSEWLIPGWGSEWIENARDYISYTGSLTSLQCMFGNRVGLVLTALAVLLVVYRFRGMRAIYPDSESFRYSNATLFALTMIMVPRSQWRTYDEVILFPAFVYLCICLRHFKHETAVTGILHLTAIALLVWPIFATMFLTGKHLLGFTFSTQSSLQAPTYSIFLVAPTVLLSLLMLKPQVSVAAT